VSRVPSVLLAYLSLGLALRAQTASPALFVSPDGAEQGAAPTESLAVTRLDVEARIAGILAETRMTLTFANPHDRALAGDLYFTNYGRPNEARRTTTLRLEEKKETVPVGEIEF
jgi:hypothetical protein